VGGFVLGAEASGADIDFSWSSFYHNRSAVNIRKPASGGVAFGVADTMPKLSLFTANFTLHGNLSILLDHPRKSQDFCEDPVNLKFCQ
jgi:hypothetical protein